MTDLMTLEKVTTDQDKFINQLIETKGANLPATIEDVKKVFEFTDLKAKAWKLLVQKLDKLEEHTEAYQSALRSGQQWSISALYSQKRMGEITREMPSSNEAKLSFGKGKTEYLTEQGVNKSDISANEQLANNPETLDRVIESTLARGEIPTKTAVLNTIRVENAKKREAVQEKKSNDKLDNQRPQAVADYYEAVKGFKAALEFAIISAERGKFDPAGKNFLMKKNSEITDLIYKLEDLV